MDAGTSEGAKKAAETRKLTATPTVETRMGRMGYEQRKTGDYDVHHGEQKVGTIKKQYKRVSGGIVRSRQGGGTTGASKHVSVGFQGHHEPSNTYHNGKTSKEVLSKMEKQHFGE